MTTKTWKIGDVYWQAGGSQSGREEIIAEPRESKDEAECDAQEWLSSLSDRERKYAETWVRAWKVIDLDDDGGIGTVATI